MTVSHEQLQRSLGRVEATQEGFKERMDRFESKIDEGFAEVKKIIHESQENSDRRWQAVDDRLKVIEARELERKGAWRILVVVAGGVSALVAALFKYLTH